MPRRPASSVVILIVGLIAGALSYPQLNRWLRRSERAMVPVAAPGSAPIEGPFFSDGDRVADRIIAAMNHTQKSLHIAIYDLTHPDITATIEAAHRRGVEVRIVADERQAREPHSEIPYLRSHGIPIRLSRGYKGNRSIMHNKFAVFDGRLAETGSFNWTTSAESYNFENAIFISDAAVVRRFEYEFNRIWEQAQ